LRFTPTLGQSGVATKVMESGWPHTLLLHLKCELDWKFRPSPTTIVCEYDIYLSLIY
jgi:hypothetical protein